MKFILAVLLLSTIVCADQCIVKWKAVTEKSCGDRLYNRALEIRYEKENVRRCGHTSYGTCKVRFRTVPGCSTSADALLERTVNRFNATHCE